MKKKFLICVSVMISLFLMTFSALAASPYAENGGTSFFGALAKSRFAVAELISLVLIVIVAVFVCCNKKIKDKLNNSTASQMTNVFIVFFSIMGLSCLGLALATDGDAWFDMMSRETSLDVLVPHLADYVKTVKDAGLQAFSRSAASFSPMGLLVFFLLAQFLPTQDILSNNSLTYPLMFKNQTVILLYLYLVILTVVLLSGMNRSVIRRNGFRIRDELVVFLMIVSFPTMYCIETGSIVGLCLAAVMFFILFRDSEKRYLRELSLVLLALSAAIVPYTLAFALLLVKKDDKNAKKNLIKTAVYFLVMFICPAFFTGFGNMAEYLKNFFSVSADGFKPGNMSIVNLFAAFGLNNTVFLYVVLLLTCVISLVCAVKLPEMWQKTAAIAYFIMNIYGVSKNTLAIFIFIPFVFLLSENKHKAIDWLYFSAFTLIITPLPAWYYFEKAEFGALLESLGLPYISAANNLYALFAVQMIFVLLVCQTIKTNKKQKVADGKKVSQG